MLGQFDEYFRLEKMQQLTNDMDDKTKKFVKKVLEIAASTKRKLALVNNKFDFNKRLPGVSPVKEMIMGKN